MLGKLPPGLPPLLSPPKDEQGEYRDMVTEEKEAEEASEVRETSLSSSGDGEAKELESFKSSEHEQEGHVKKHRSCPACQTEGGPVLRHMRAPLEDQGQNTKQARARPMPVLQSFRLPAAGQDTSASCYYHWPVRCVPRSKVIPVTPRIPYLMRPQGSLCMGYLLRIARCARRRNEALRG